MAYQCDSADGNTAAVLITNLEGGDVLALCPACFPAWVNATANALAEPADSVPGAVPPGDVEGSTPGGTVADTAAGVDTAAAPVAPDDQPIDLYPRCTSVGDAGKGVSWECTKAAGHDGPHAYVNKGGEVLAAWSQDPAESESPVLAP